MRESADAGHESGPCPPVEVALLDRRGVIVQVNRVWEEFCRSNHGDLGRCGVGVSYLAVCDAAAGDRHAYRVGSAIRRAIRGGLPAPSRIEIPCDAPDQARWFDVLVSSRFGDDGSCVGAIVTLSLRAEHRAAVPAAPSWTAHGDRAGAWGLTQDAAVPLLEASPDGLLVVDPSGSIMYVNRQLETLSGYDRAELTGRRVEMLVPDGLRGRHENLRSQYGMDPRRRLMGEGAPLDLRRRDGSTLAVEISLAPTSVDAHPMVLAAVRDITARRELEERLRLVADLLGATGDAVVVVDVATRRRVYVNQAALDRTGYTVEELETVPIGAPRDPQESARLQEAITSVVQGRVREATLDSHVQHRDGTSVPVEIRITHRPAASGTVGSGHVILVIRDISERLATQERLAASEASFRAAFERAPIGMAVTHLDAGGHRRIVRANAALADILAVAADQLRGRDFAEFTYPEDEPDDRATAAAMASGKERTFERRKRYRRTDGTTAWVDVRSTVVDPSDSIILSQLVDVTDTYRAERQRAQRAAMAEVVAEVTTEVLAGQPLRRTYQQVVHGVARVFGAANVGLGFPDPRTGLFSLSAAVGPISTALMTGELPVHQEAARQFARQTLTVFDEPPQWFDDARRALAGPGAAVQFPSEANIAGLVVVVRAPGSDPFSPAEADLLQGLVRQLALAIELGRARADQLRLALLEERQRIARDLHDTVIQDLIAVGMQLDAGARHEPDSARVERDSAIIDQLDGAVRRLRSSVFDLDRPPRDIPLPQAVREVVSQAARVLGHTPTVTLNGALDTLPDPVAEEIVAVLREALSNIARHAHATATAITLTEDLAEVTLSVQDNGLGVAPGALAGNGLANMRQRAQALGGQATLVPGVPSGTRLVWIARPLGAARELGGRTAGDSAGDAQGAGVGWGSGPGS